MALTDFLSSIADAIRSKDGTTEPIIATDFPQRILDIQSGGGDNPNWLTLGTITMSENFSFYKEEPIIINHGLGVTPKAFFFVDVSDLTISTHLGGITLGIYLTQNLVEQLVVVNSIWRNSSSTGAYPMRSELKNAIELNETSAIIGMNITEKATATYTPWFLLNGHTYLWLAIKDEVTT